MNTEAIKSTAILSLKLFAGVFVGDVTVGVTRAYIKAGPGGVGQARGLFGTYTFVRGVRVDSI